MRPTRPNAITRPKMAPRTMLGHKGGRSDIAPGYIDGVRKQAPGRRCVKAAFTLNGGASDSLRDETASDARWPVQATVIANSGGIASAPTQVPAESRLSRRSKNLPPAAQLDDPNIRTLTANRLWRSLRREVANATEAHVLRPAHRRVSQLEMRCALAP